MKNFRQEGWTIYAPVPDVGGCKSGDVILLGTDGLLGVATVDGVQGQVLAFSRKGIYNVPKNSSETWAVGDLIYWDSGSGYATNVSGSGLVEMGWATAIEPNYLAAAGNNATTGDVLFKV